MSTLAARASVLVSDPTLRDGNHAVKHGLTGEQMRRYAAAAEAAALPILEVGHGNGLGASSLQVGLAAIPDEEMLTVTRGELVNTRLAVHVIPGFATIHRDLAMAVDVGVDVFRIASHCTEADLTQRHITYVRRRPRRRVTPRACAARGRPMPRTARSRAGSTR